MKKRASLLVIPLLAACSSMPDTEGIGSGISNALDISPYLHPYRIDVRQGNLVTQDMVAQLKPGLTKDQVRFVLGTPMLTDIFHADRWDYVYRLQKGSDGEIQQRRLAVFFENGKLVRLGGDVVGDAGVGSGAAAPKPPTRIIEIKAPEAKADAAALQPKPEEAQTAGAAAPAVSK
jgi:outer membrane protein assembly factor BamE